MSVFVLITDESGAVVAVKREGDTYLGSRSRLPGDGLPGYKVDPTPFRPPNDTTLWELRFVRDSIEKSPRLTAEQKTEALALFRAGIGADSYVTEVQQPLLSKAGDAGAGKGAYPTIIYFVDP